MHPPPSWYSLIGASLRFEAKLLAGSWVTWFLLLGFPAGALLLGAVRGPTSLSGTWFGTLGLAAALSVIAVVFGHQLTASGPAGTYRELEHARAADALSLTAARVLVAGKLGFLIMFFTSITISGRLRLLAPVDLVAPWAGQLWLIGVASAGLGAFSAAITRQRPAAGLPLALATWAAWALLAAPRLGPAAPDPFLRVAEWDPIFAAASGEAMLLIITLGTALLALLGITVAALPSLREGLSSRSVWRSSSLLLVLLVTVLLAASLFLTEKARFAKQAALINGAPLQVVLKAEWRPRQRQLLVTGPTSQLRLDGPARPVNVAQETLPDLGAFVPPATPYAPYVGAQGAAVPVARLVDNGHGESDMTYGFSLIIPDGWSAHGCAAFMDSARCDGSDRSADWLLITKTGAVTGWLKRLDAYSPDDALPVRIFMNNVAEALLALGAEPVEFVPVASHEPFWFAPRSAAMPVEYGEPAVRTRIAHYRAAQLVALAMMREQSTGARGATTVTDLPTWLLAVVDRTLFALGVTTFDLTEAIRRGSTSSVQEGTLGRVHPFLPGPSESEERGEFDDWWVLIDELLDANVKTAEEMLVWAADHAGYASPDRISLLQVVNDE